jgi:hypothetical protein
MFPLEASAFVPGEGTSSTQAIAKPGFRDGPPSSVPAHTSALEASI